MALLTRFQQALGYLLPTGPAWPRDPSSVWMRLLGGLAGLFQAQHDHAAQAVREWQPHTTHTRLDEWEAALGLPDRCFDLDRTVAERQASVLARLRGTTGAYADSSPSAPAAIEALCAALGLVVKVRYNTPFRVTRDRVGRRLGRRDGKLYVIIRAPASTDRLIGRGNTVLAIGDKVLVLPRPMPISEALLVLPDDSVLVIDEQALAILQDASTAAGTNVSAIACVLERIVPARFSIHVVTE